MNGNKSTNSSTPLFYIIQPKIKLKQTEQNMQEIFHGRPESKIQDEQMKINPEGIIPEHAVQQNKADLLDEIDNQLKIVDKVSNPEVKESEINREDASHSLENLDNQVNDLAAISTEIENVDEEEAVAEPENEFTEIAQETNEITEIMSITSDQKEMERAQIKAKLTRLSRYPVVVPKPVCELKIKDEVLTCVILSKRGNQLKVNLAGSIRFLLIDDIEEVTIIS